MLPYWSWAVRVPNRFERYNQMEEILAELPGLDCGSCGAPTCAALAEDVVRARLP